MQPEFYGSIETAERDLRQTLTLSYMWYIDTGGTEGERRG